MILKIHLADFSNIIACLSNVGYINNTLSLNQFPVHNKEQTFLDQQRRRRRCDIVFEGDNFQEEKKWPLLMKAEWVTFFT